MRSFIAIDTGLQVQMMIESVVEKLKRMGFRASWVPGGNSPLTISFLDSVELQRLELLATMLSKIGRASCRERV